MLTKSKEKSSKRGEVQVESVQLTCQMAALASLSMQGWRSCNMVHCLQIVTLLSIQTVQ